MIDNSIPHPAPQDAAIRARNLIASLSGVEVEKIGILSCRASMASALMGEERVEVDFCIGDLLARTTLRVVPGTEDKAESSVGVW